MHTSYYSVKTYSVLHETYLRQVLFISHAILSMPCRANFSKNTIFIQVKILNIGSVTARWDEIRQAQLSHLCRENDQK